MRGSVPSVVAQPRRIARPMQYRLVHRYHRYGYGMKIADEIPLGENHLFPLGTPRQSDIWFIA